MGEARTLTVKVEAVSPKGRHVAVFQPPVAVPASATEVRFPVVAPIGNDWEEGVWALQLHGQRRCRRAADSSGSRATRTTSSS